MKPKHIFTLLALGTMIFSACDLIGELISSPTNKETTFNGSEEAVLILSEQGTIQLGKLASSFTVKVDYNSEFDITTDVDWIFWEDTDTKGELKSDEIVFSVTTNESSDTREGIIRFSTKDGSISENLTVVQSGELAITQGEYVDLGLSVDWASCNLGATKPEEKGDYYAWAENYVRKPGSRYTVGANEVKYNYYRPNSDSVFNDKRVFLSDDDDAATATLGNQWRMPTQDEVSELLSLAHTCPYEYNGNQGLLLVGKNGNTLFVPASSYSLGYGESPGQQDVVCFWTSQVHLTKNDEAYCLMSHIAGSSVPGLPFLTGSPMTFYRCGGMPVRAVRRADIKFSEVEVSDLSENQAIVNVNVDFDDEYFNKYAADASAMRENIKFAGLIVSASNNFNNVSQIDSVGYTSLQGSKMTVTLKELKPDCSYYVRPVLCHRKEGSYTGVVHTIQTPKL